MGKTGDICIKLAINSERKEEKKNRKEQIRKIVNTEKLEM